MKETEISADAAKGAWLVITAGADKGKTFRMGQRSMTIGRTAQNFIQLLDPDVSRTHCTVRWTGTSYEITDADSTHGVVIAGMKQQRHVLKDGDVLQLAGTTIRFDATATHAEDYALGWKAIGAATEASTAMGSVASLVAFGKLQQIKQTALDRNALLAQIAAAVIAEVDADRVMFVVPAPGGSWRPERVQTVDGLTEDEKRIPPDRRLMRHVCQAGEKSGATSAQFDGSAPVAALAAPETAPDGAITGIVYVDQVRPRDTPPTLIQLDFVRSVASTAYGA